MNEKPTMAEMEAWMADMHAQGLVPPEVIQGAQDVLAALEKAQAALLEMDA
jgi:hypothetical protein